MIQFEVPKNLIAQTPAHPRDSARLLVYDRASKKIEDTVFSDIGNYLPAHSTIVVNSSRVENCRWIFPGNVEVFVLEKLGNRTIRAMVRPGRKFKLGTKLRLASDVSAKVLRVDQDGFRTLELSVLHDDALLKAYEHVPLPPYIQQDDSLADEYQTVYARELGSRAAPTAGLHFTPELLKRLATDHDIIEITLHVGLGTFAALTERQLRTKKLHEEAYSISSEAAQKICVAQHITAVGTTTARTLETAAGRGLSYNGQSGLTDIFIQPGDEFKRVDSLITNFHLPGTSLLLMVEAFIGSEAEMLKIYKHAIAEQYRFYSFGDAMLII